LLLLVQNQLFFLSLSHFTRLIQPTLYTLKNTLLYPLYHLQRMPRTSHQLASSPSASSNRPRRTPSLNTTDKSALLSALAQELKLSKFSADESAQSMIKLESLVQSFPSLSPSFQTLTDE